ncbi:MAG: NAD-dependent epimerase/dehydratase family protein [Gemmataceae bacterium]
MNYLITGATGFVGGHLAEACRARGHEVAAIVRPQSDTGLLQELGATLHQGDFGDPAVARAALANADVVVHCAAKVGDRGDVEEYRQVNVHAVRRLLDACVERHGQKPLTRFVHMSSLGVYEARHHHGTTEEEPLPDSHLDGYSQTKVEQEKLMLEYQQKHGLPIVILRPGFVYGPRDRTVLTKVISKMRTGKVHFLGADQRAQNTIFVLNLVDAVFLAVDKGQPGQAYNLTDGEFVSKERFFNAIADGMGLKRSKQVLPRWLAALVVRVVKRQMTRAVKAGRKPWLTPGKFKFIQLNLDFNIEKARRELGYTPRFTFDEGMRETLAWYQKNPAVLETR